MSEIQQGYRMDMDKYRKQIEKYKEKIKGN